LERELPLKQIVEGVARTLEWVDRSSTRLTGARRQALDAPWSTASVSPQRQRAVDPTASGPAGDAGQAQRTIDEVGRDVRKLVENVDGQANLLTANLERTSTRRGLMQDAQKTLRSIDEQLGPVLTSLRSASDAARDALRKAETSLTQVDGVLDGNSAMGYQLAEALNELARAARTLRVLGEEIDRQPNVLLFGRGGSKD
jgi:paraquat-inducible protein B